MCFYENNYVAADRWWNLSNGRMSEQSLRAPRAEHVMKRKWDLNNTDRLHMNSDSSSFTCSLCDSNCMIIWTWLCRYKAGKVHMMCFDLWHSFPKACFIALGWKLYCKSIVLVLTHLQPHWQHWLTSHKNQNCGIHITIKQMQLSELKVVRTPMASELSVEVTTTEVSQFLFQPSGVAVVALYLD